MSAAILQRLQQDGRLTVDELADLLCLQPQSVYPYLDSREMSYSRFRTVFRRAADGPTRLAIQTAFLSDLLQGTAWVATHLPADLDANGDGDINMLDAMRHAATAMRACASLIDELASGETAITDARLAAAEDACQETFQGLASARQVLGHMQQAQTRRRRARPLSVNGNGRGVARG